jgi:hypothetical protein
MIQLKKTEVFYLRSTRIKILSHRRVRTSRLWTSHSLWEALGNTWKLKMILTMTLMNMDYSKNHSRRVKMRRKWQQKARDDNID